MISKEQVKHIADLARISLSEEEVVKFQKELSSILDYVEKLKEVETKDIKTQTQAFSQDLEGKKSLLIREDKIDQADSKTIEKIHNQMPQKEGRHLKVKGVFEE